MAINYRDQVTLGIVAGTLAAWLQDNGPHYDEVNDKGEADADEFGMFTMATCYLRMYKELIDIGEVEVLSSLKPETHEVQ
jgi:hypothetical protein